MNTTRTATVLVLLAFLASDGLWAQRRTSGGSGSDTRGTPSRGSSSGSSGSGSRGSSGSSGSSGSDRRGNSTGSSSGSSSSSGSASSRERGSSSGSSGAASATENSSGSNRGSKIGAVRRTADRAVREHGRVVYVTRGVYIGSCYECDYWGWYGPRWGWYHGGWWYPSRRPYHGERDDRDEAEQPGQGYDDYPYAGADDDPSFVRSNVMHRRAFGAVTGQYFSDAGSDMKAGRFGIEGARGIVRGALEYGFYTEPTVGSRDQLHNVRLGVGLQPRLGDIGYLVVGIGARGISVNSGAGIPAQNAGGIDGELGVQLLPRKPFGINVTGRIASMQWEGSTDHFALRELNTTGSVFMNRVELQAGWHWLKIGSSNPAFGGPVAGLRIWF